MMKMMITMMMMMMMVMKMMIMMMMMTMRMRMTRMVTMMKSPTSFVELLRDGARSTLTINRSQNQHQNAGKHF